MKMNGEASSGLEAVTTGEWSALAESRSRTYGFLAAVYNRLPDEQFAASLSSPDMAAFLSSLAGTMDLPKGMRQGLGLIEGYMRGSDGKEVKELQTELAVDRTRLLRGVKPGVSPPPPYESVYATAERQPKMQVTVAVRQAYAAAGVGLPEGVHEQPDFIGLELDFMRHLCMKESEAWDMVDRDRAIELLKSEQTFLVDHVARWIPRFCDLAIEHAELDFYRGIALMTKAFVLEEVDRLAGHLAVAGASPAVSEGGQG